MARRTGARIRDNKKNWDKLQGRIAKLQKKGNNSVWVGLFGKQDSEVVIYAAANEFGTETIPERSFLRAMISENKEFLKEFVKKEFIKIAKLKQPVDTALKLIGEMGEGLVKAKIKKGPFTPLKPATIRKKGSSKPLIDKGRMIGAITWQKGKK